MTNTRQTIISQLTDGDVVLTIQGKPVQGPEHVVTRVVNVASGKAKVTRVDFAFGGVVPFYPSTTACTVTV